MTEYVAIVRDADGNELFFGGADVVSCKEYCRDHGITGENGEYIALGYFNTETRVFDLDDAIEYWSM